MKNLFSKLNRNNQVKDPLHLLNKSSNPRQSGYTNNGIVTGNDGTLAQNSQISKRTLIIFAAGFAAIGAILILRSFAAETTVTLNNSSVGTANNQFEFVGNWVSGADSAAYNGDEHYSNAAGAYYQVRFSGTQVRVNTTTDPNHGIAGISVDGGAETMVDTYSAIRTNQALVYSSPTLTNSSHILKVRVTGNKNASAAAAYIVADKVDIIAPETTTAACNYAPFPSRLKASGRTLIDENGCVMPKLKGFNIHAAPQSNANFVWDNSHFADIKNNGGRVLRTVVQWDGYESQQGVVNEANLATLDKHIARAQRNGLYVILDLHLNTGDVPSWTVNGDDETEKYFIYGQNITQTLAQRYSAPRTADGLTIDPKTVLGFNLNEPPQDSTTINGNNSIPTFETQQKQMISWFRQSSPNWIGFVSLAYANQKPQLVSPKISANPDAYDSVGGNVVFDAHDYLVYNDSTDPNTDSRWDHGVLHDTRNPPGAHWLALPLSTTRHDFPADPALADRAKSQMKAFLKPFDTYANAAQMPLMIGEFGWNGDTTGSTGKAGYYAAKREAMNSVNPAIEIYWIYATSYTQDMWSAKASSTTWDPEVLAWLKDSSDVIVPPPADTTNPTPAVLTATPGSGQASLTWTAATDNVGVTEYEIWHMVGTVDTFVKKVLVSEPRSATVTGLTNGTTYNFRVVAYDAVRNPANSNIVPVTPTGTGSANFELLYEDNFDTLNTSSTSPSSWQLYNSPGHAGNGLRRPEAFSIGTDPLDGSKGLIITAKPVLQADGTTKTVSGGMSNRTNIAYGRYEVRVRVEADPTLTMSGLALTWPQSGLWPDDGELDWFETGSGGRTDFFSWMHWPCSEGACGSTYQTGFRHTTDATQYHTYVMEWTPSSIKMFRDGAVVKTTYGEVVNGTDAITDPTHIPDVPHHVSLQLDALKSAPITQPVRQYVDYVKVYKWTGNTTADTTAPTVAWEVPAEGATVSGQFTEAANNCRATASDGTGSGVDRVEFFLNGSLINKESFAPYNCFVVDTTKYANGPYTLTAQAYDKAGNASPRVDRSVTFSNTTSDTTPPTATITDPPHNATVAGTKTVVATASDNSGTVAGIQFKLDGANVGTEDTVAPYNYSINTVTLANGSHTITAVARDNSGNLSPVPLTPAANTNYITITVNNSDTTAPSAPTSFSATATSSTSVNLAWSGASDNVDVTGYFVYRYLTANGASSAAVIANLDNVGSYTDNTALADTNYTYYVIAKDAAGNPSSPSVSRQVTTPPNPVVDTTLPSVPANLAAVAVGPRQVNLTWTPSTDSGGSGLKEYRIYRNGTLVATVPATNCSTTGCSWGENKLRASTNYSYTIEAVDGAGNKSPRTASVSVTTPRPGS